MGVALRGRPAGRVVAGMDGRRQDRGDRVRRRSVADPDGDRPVRPTTTRTWRRRWCAIWRIPPGQVLDGDKVVVEARFGTAFRSLLQSHGWVDGDPWTPLVRDLSDPVEGHDLRVEVVGPERVSDRVAVQRGAFDRSAFTAELWEAMSPVVGIPDRLAAWWGTTIGTTRSRRSRCGRPAPAGPGCWSRWASTATIAVTATAPRSASPRRRPCASMGASSATVATPRREPGRRRDVRVGWVSPDARRDRLRLPAVSPTAPGCSRPSRTVVPLGSPLRVRDRRVRDGRQGGPEPGHLLGADRRLEPSVELGDDPFARREGLPAVIGQTTRRTRASEGSAVTVT